MVFFLKPNIYSAAVALFELVQVAVCMRGLLTMVFFSIMEVLNKARLRLFWTIDHIAFKSLGKPACGTGCF